MTVQLLGEYRPGYGLPRESYLSEAVYAEEQARIFRSNWFFAGHSIELAGAGAYLTLDVGNVPVVIVRDSGGVLRGYLNICRHRGSIICTSEQGRAARLTCPYHSWTYALDGALIAAPMMGAGFDKAAHGLKPVQVAEFDGLVFVNLAEDPAPIDALRDHLSPILSPQGMDRAKIAVMRDYTLDLNWKLVVENNRECYHCKANHPEYVSVQYDTENDNPALQAEIAERLADCSVRWEKAGLDTSRVNTSSDSTADWFRANRTPVRRDMVTESPDGQAVCAVLMGGFNDPDMGTARANTNINFWCHANADYAHNVRITPVSPTRTIVRGYWLVDEKAEEGRDYDADQVAAFHHQVMMEDWEICRRQWRGVTAPGFEPGPYSPLKEQNVDRYIRWYAGQMRSTV
ncbi:aromatic ring-hydroxylating oxygenase subunit alpha [Sphingomonas alpina]|uniref:Aromatic ring-hydroxylating dioxygenase subunit alpha n=1 Tax=Sphingomonas alpina TaxID=653931 RepID=A0A7H0LL08_9SPHN|nr:aromatic ring-hydroxylating dioxygenase subunit alpha [Sphingomonas alpina]QNQ10361.1 aromatic ring-hydroxylating dioxygenase subunit alpha [Sphingomonas alpina]